MTPGLPGPLVSELFQAARSGDRGALARLLSIVERGGKEGRELAKLTFDKAGNNYAIGFTGAPGSGKSTLTNALVKEVRTRLDSPVAVLAVDPSSPVTGGAILGDRVRMQEHALDDAVFIRSMASRGHLGGLAAAVPEAIRLLDSAGWPLVVVETVGVGQVEIDVAGTCDTVVVVLNPGWGDSVQANKAGLLEIADVFVINKADRPGAKQAARDLRQMIQLSSNLGWIPPILETVAVAGEGIGELWEAICTHRDYLEQGARLALRRAERVLDETVKVARRRLDSALAKALATSAMTEVRVALKDKKIDPDEAADRFVAAVVGELRISSEPPQG